MRRTLPGVLTVSNKVAHLSLYRKYRSQTFNELVGQDHVVRTLRNSLATGRISHAYLFTGPRGTGKTSTARLLAKCLCADGGATPDPDPDSEISRLIARGECVDVVEMDAASESGVDDIRTAIVEAVEYKPMMCPYKVFIIDEVHDLSPKAFDALLKTIEEPPPHVVFILATTEFAKVPATVKSRCQKFEFHRASMSDLIGRLDYVAAEEAVEAEPAAIAAIARMADGGYRDALSLLEQVMLTSEGKITLAHVQDQLGLVSDELIDRLLLAIASGNVPEILAVTDNIAHAGRDPRATLDSMIYRLADLTRAAYRVDVGSSGDAAQEAALHATAAQLGPERMLGVRKMAADASRAIREVSLPRLWLESKLIEEASQAADIAPQRPAGATSSQTTASNPQPEVVKPSLAASSQPAQDPPKAAEPDPALDQAAAVWTKLMASLPENVTHRNKLMEAQVEAVRGNTIIVGISNKMFLDWFTENPKRIAYVLGQLKTICGEQWSLELRGAKKNGAKTAPADQAVELPAEGQALHDKVVSVFRS